MPAPPNIPTIWVSIPYGMSARNTLRSDIFKILKARARLVILTPLFADAEFSKEFGGGNVVLCDLPKNTSLLYRGFRRLLDIIEGYYFTRKTKIETLLILEKSLRAERPDLYWIRVTIGTILGGSATVLRLLQCMQWWFATTGYFDSLRQKYPPNLVFVTHALALEEFTVAHMARRFGAAVVAMIHSWDNITAKTGMRTAVGLNPGRMLPLEFDRVIVWNEIQRQELEQFYRYPRERILVTGVPQFDRYVNHEYPERVTFMRRIAGDPAKRVILFAAASAMMMPVHRQKEIVDQLVKALRNDEFSQSSQLLIRWHPGLDLSMWETKLAGVPGVLFQRPSPAFSACRLTSGWKIGESDEIHLAETLRHSDVVVNFCSTMAIDASMMGKPVVCIGFDGHETVPYLESVAKWYDYTHYRPIVESGGARIARSPDELIPYINAYLTDPNRDAEGRKVIVEKLCYRRDGRAGARIGEMVAAFAEQSMAARSSEVTHQPSPGKVCSHAVS